MVSMICGPLNLGYHGFNLPVIDGDGVSTIRVGVTAAVRADVTVDGAAQSAQGTVTVYGNGTAMAQLQQATSSPLYWYSPRQLAVTLLLACGNPAPVEIKLIVPVTAKVLPGAAIVSTLGAVAQWVGTTGSVSTVVSIGRVGAIRNMMLCDSGGTSNPGGLLGWQLGDEATGGNDRCDTVAYARGAVVGNVLLLVGALVLILCLGCIWRGAEHASKPWEGGMVANCTAAALRVALPSSLLSLWTVTVPSTAAGVTVLWMTTAENCGSTAGDVCLGLLGAANCLVPLFLMTCLATRGPWALFRLHLMPCHKHVAAATTTDARGSRALPPCTGGWRRGYHRLSQFLNHAMSRQLEWRANEGLGDVDPIHSWTGTFRCAQAILLEHRLLWYAALDSGLIVVLSAFSSLSGLLDDKGCLIFASVVVALMLLQLCVLVVVQPFTSQFSYAYAGVSLSLTFFESGAQLWAMQLASSSELLYPLQMAYAACDVMVSSLSLCKLLVSDVPATGKALLRLLREIFQLLRDRRWESPPLVLHAVNLLSEPESDDVLLDLASAELCDDAPLCSSTERLEVAAGSGHHSPVDDATIPGGSFLVDVSDAADDLLCDMMRSSSTLSDVGGDGSMLSSPAAAPQGLAFALVVEVDDEHLPPLFRWSSS